MVREVFPALSITGDAVLLFCLNPERQWTPLWIILSAIVGEVVKNYGNGVEIVNKPLFNEQIPYIQMHEETGYEFLRRIAYQYGEWFYYDGQKLHFGNPQKDKNETVTYDVELETVSLVLV